MLATGVFEARMLLKMREILHTCVFFDDKMGTLRCVGGFFDPYLLH